MGQSSPGRAHRELWIRPARPADGARISALIHAVYDEYGLSPDPHGDDRDLDDIESFYGERGGRFEVLADAQGRVLGTVGLLPLSETVCELRKMYFRRRLRGQGWGKVVLDRAIRIAQQAAFAEMGLKTASVLVEAIGLYQRFGFRAAEAGATTRCDRALALTLADYAAPPLPAFTLHEVVK